MRSVVLSGQPLAAALAASADQLRGSTLLVVVVAEDVVEVGQAPRDPPRHPADVARLGIVVHSKRPTGFLHALSQWIRPAESLYLHLAGTHSPDHFNASDVQALHDWLCGPASNVSHAYLRGSRVFSDQSMLCIDMRPPEALRSITYLDTHWCRPRPRAALGPGRVAVYSGGLGDDGRWRRVQVPTWAASPDTARTAYDCGQRGAYGTDLGADTDPDAIAATCLSLVDGSE